MDRNSPDTYVEASAEDSIEATKALITHIRSIAVDDGVSEPLVYPILTPRFAISCTDTLLTSLGALASSDPSLHIQTHISENPSEVAFTKSLFPACSSYTDVYDKHGLLRANTVLAHAVHLEEDEVKLIIKKNAGISHCPTSNFNLSSGVARVGEYLDLGIKIGLGTDVSGGFCPSILTAVQHASIASKVMALNKTPAPSNHHPVHSHQPYRCRQLPVSTLLHLATLGGAQVCDMSSRIGSFEVGKSFDALVVNVRSGHGNPGLWGVQDANSSIGGVDKSDEDALCGMLEMFLFCGDDRNIRRVYVQGRFVGGKEFGKWHH